MRLVLSGTGIEFQALQDTLLSSACKIQPYQVVYDIGAFDDPQKQAEYIRQYIPATSDNPYWEDFFTRAWTWFHGR
jgi:hypothetical protein